MMRRAQLVASMRRPVARLLSSSADPARTIRIGDVSCQLSPPVKPSLVPRAVSGSRSAFMPHSSSSALSTVQWLLKKKVLKQDALLLGTHPATMRGLVNQFAAALELEVEYVSITRDSTESDLKQRRELSGGNVLYTNQPVVEAALHGRLLVLEGLEKAERNLLPGASAVLHPIDPRVCCSMSALPAHPEVAGLSLNAGAQ